MSSFAWMKYLESAPERYDRGIQLLSRGRIGEVYERIAASSASPGKRVLDLGCGTGGVALACASRGARVTAIDSNAEILEIARAKLLPRDCGGTIEWLELGIAEVEDRFAEESFDAVVSCLVFSELSPDEQAYALDMARSRLVPGGHLVIADETRPSSKTQRAWHSLQRLPLSVATYLLTQTTTQPVERLADRIRKAGFSHVEDERLWGDTFVIVHAERGEAVP